MVHPVRNILNRLRWDSKESADNYVITYRHRGAPGDVKRLKASRISRLGKSYFTVSEESAHDTEVTIPFHRILEIRNVKDNSVLWRSRRSS